MSKTIFSVVFISVALTLVFWSASKALVVNDNGASSTDMKQYQAVIQSNSQIAEAGLSTGLVALSKKVDFTSFLGKTVKIPIPRQNPSDFPGEDSDYLYITPPQPYLDKKTGKIVWDPIRTIFLTSGKGISDEKVVYVKDQIEKQISFVFAGKKALFDDLAVILRNQMIQKMGKKIGFKNPNDSRNSVGFLISEARADTANVNLNLNLNLNDNVASDLGTILGTDQMSQLNQMLDTNDPNVKQMFMLLLLNFIMNQGTAQASTLDKTTCLNNGGEWLNSTCLMPTTGNCQDGEIDFGANNIGDGECHAISDLKSSCTNSGGTWSKKTVTDPNDNSSDSTSLFCKTQDTMTFKVDLTSSDNSNSSQTKYTCVCPDGYCGDATGKCISEDEAAGDSDKDGVANGKDKCPKTASGESVNMNEASGDYGCSCTDLKQRGRVQAVACPASQCVGQMWSQYPPQATADQLCQDGFIQDPSAFCIPTQTMTQQCIDQDKQNQQAQQQQDQQNQQMMQMAMQALQSLMKGGGGGGSSGGGGGGSSGGGGGGGGQQPGSPGSPSSPSKPSSPSTTPEAPAKPSSTPGAQVGPEDVYPTKPEELSGDGTVPKPAPESPTPPTAETPSGGAQQPGAPSSGPQVEQVGPNSSPGQPPATDKGMDLFPDESPTVPSVTDVNGNLYSPGGEMEVPTPPTGYSTNNSVNPSLWTSTEQPNVIPGEPQVGPELPGSQAEGVDSLLNSSWENSINITGAEQKPGVENQTDEQTKKQQGETQPTGPQP